MKHILDKSFIYTRSIDTDIRKTFAKLRAEQARAKAEREQIVAQIKPRVKGRTP